MLANPFTTTRLVWLLACARENSSATRSCSESSLSSNAASCSLSCSPSDQVVDVIHPDRANVPKSELQQMIAKVRHFSEDSAVIPRAPAEPQGIRHKSHLYVWFPQQIWRWQVHRILFDLRLRGSSKKIRAQISTNSQWFH